MPISTVMMPKRVAVGLGRGDGAVADDARAARAVDDGHRLAEFLLHQGCQNARRGVGAAAGTPGHDDGDRPFRIGCLGAAVGQSQRGNGRDSGKQCSTQHDLSPLLFYG
jgi:hypothetical protein